MSFLFCSLTQLAMPSSSRSHLSWPSLLMVKPVHGNHTFNLAKLLSSRTPALTIKPITAKIPRKTISKKTFTLFKNTFKDWQRLRLHQPGQILVKFPYFKKRPSTVRTVQTAEKALLMEPQPLSLNKTPNHCCLSRIPYTCDLWLCNILDVGLSVLEVTDELLLVPVLINIQNGFLNKIVFQWVLKWFFFQ